VSNVQILTIALTIPTAFLAVLMGVLLNNARLGDIRDLVNRRVEDVRLHVEDVKNVLEAKIDKSHSQLQLLIEKNHSETMLKFAELDNRLSRIEGERRIVQ